MARRWSECTHGQRTQAVAGIVMVVLGFAALLVIYSSVWWWGLFIKFINTLLAFLFPCATLLLICYLIWAWKKGKFDRALTEKRGVLRKSQNDKRIAGVCGGIAAYLHVDSMVIRIIALFLFLASPPITAFLYFILAFAVPSY